MGEELGSSSWARGRTVYLQEKWVLRSEMNMNFLRLAHH